jgi:hypothetical protein
MKFYWLNTKFCCVGVEIKNNIIIDIALFLKSLLDRI